jgi:hypothetical protein
MKNFLILTLLLISSFIHAQQFELIYSPDSTEFILTQKGDNEIFKDSNFIISTVLEQIRTNYDNIARSKKSEFVSKQKINSLTKILKSIKPDTAYWKKTKLLNTPFTKGRKFYLRIGDQKYNCIGKNSGRIENSKDKKKYWGIKVYSDRYIRLDRVDFKGEQQSFFLYKSDQGLYRSSYESAIKIYLRRK